MAAARRDGSLPPLDEGRLTRMRLEAPHHVNPPPPSTEDDVHSAGIHIGDVNVATVAAGASVSCPCNLVSGVLGRSRPAPGAGGANEIMIFEALTASHPPPLRPRCLRVLVGRRLHGAPQARKRNPSGRNVRPAAQPSHERPHLHLRGGTPRV